MNDKTKIKLEKNQKEKENCEKKMKLTGVKMQ